MDWHPVISVQQQTPDNDLSCQHFICTFSVFGILSKTEKIRVSHRVKMMTRWPGRERWPKWPIDPVTQWPSSMSATYWTKISVRLVVRWVLRLHHWEIQCIFLTLGAYSPYTTCVATPLVWLTSVTDRQTDGRNCDGNSVRQTTRAKNL